MQKTLKSIWNNKFGRMAAFGCAAFFVLLCCVFPAIIFGSSTKPTPEIVNTSVDVAPTPITQAEIFPTETPGPVDKYLNEYGGAADAYIEIFSLSDCRQLQGKFNIASDNNKRAAAGTAEFKWTLGYMAAADDRMKALGCYALTTTAEPAIIDSHPKELIVDAPKIIGLSRSDAEAILGKPLLTESIASEGLDDIPNGGEMWTYQIGTYSVEVDFDSKFGVTGVQVAKGLTSEKWLLTDWPTLVSRVGLEIHIAPDVINDVVFRWQNVDGYGILIANDKQIGQVWTVRVFLCKYSSAFPCKP